MTRVELSIEPLIFSSFTTKNTASLQLAIKRYTTPTSEDKGLTLLFTHCIASHKELWEPTIERLFQLQQSKDRRLRIREAYSFDWQNHGQAAVLNEEALRSRPEGVSGFEWASAIANFVKAYHIDGRRTVAIGHSAGAGALMCTTKHFLQETPPYLAILLVEPTIVSRNLYTENEEAHNFATKLSMEAAIKRRDTWDDRESAIQWLAKRAPWKYWDPRVIRLHVEHGFRSVNSQQGEAVTLMCNKWQEAQCYAHIEPHLVAAELFATACRRTPIHIIWGTLNTFNPVYIQESLSDASEGRFAASVTKVNGAGHMVVQERPDALAEVMYDVLNTIQETSSTSSKL